MTGVGPAFALAFAQIADARVLRVLAKSFAVTLALFGLLGWAAWQALDFALGRAGFVDTLFAGAESLRGLATLALILIIGWLLWRVIAMAVIEFFAGEVIQAVEARHYPAAASQARDLSLPEELAASLGSAARALLANLAILPVALALLVTGIGPALLFWLVNAWLIGRELDKAVWLRHRHAAGKASPVGRFDRFLLGGATAGLFMLPFANFLAPVLGAAAATHLVHRQKRPGTDG